MTTTFLALAFDIVVFAITMIKTFGHGREMQKLGQLSITQLLLRDGMQISVLISMTKLLIFFKKMSTGGIYFR